MSIWGDGDRLMKIWGNGVTGLRDKRMWGRGVTVMGV